MPLSSPSLPMFRGMRPLKCWRYVGVFCEELMACAALVQVGPARQSFWAVLTRTDGRLRERTRMLPRRGTVELPPGRLRVSDSGVLLDLRLDEDEASRPSARTAVSPSGRASRPGFQRAARSSSMAVPRVRSRRSR
jgi:hypothetical protein